MKAMEQAKDNRENWNKTYEQKGLNVPWFLGCIPSFFIDLVDTIKPCKSLDLGCGHGQYADFIEKKGFTVTAIDFSQKVIDRAKSNFPKVNFQCMSVFDINDKMKTKFDFIYDISLFHHIKSSEKKKYALQVKNQLTKGGLYVVCAFNTEDKYFQGKKELFSEETDTTMYPVNLPIIVETFNDYFNILKIEQINWGKDYDKKRWFIVMEHKNGN